jgi:signal transduction histidine kinase
MSRFKIILLTVAMSVSLVGLIGLQVYWINHDLEMRQERFRLQARGALLAAIDKADQRESARLLLRTFNSELSDSLSTFFSDFAPERIEVNQYDSIIEETISGMNESRSGFTFVTSTGNGDEDQAIRINHSDGNRKNRVFVEIDDNRRTVIKDTVVILKKDSLKKSVGTSKVKIRNKLKRVDQVMEQMAFEFETRYNHITERVDTTTLDSLVRLELTDAGVRRPYGLRIRSGDSVEWQKELKGKDTTQLITARLFPGDLVTRNAKVDLFFSEDLSFFLISMWPMLLSSILFTSIVVFSFIYTLHVILRQKKLSEIKNDFINNMTHEFKTPVATIRLAADAMLGKDKNPDPEKVKLYARVISEESDRMNSYVENILQFAQFDKSGIDLHCERTDIHSLVDEVLSKMELKINEAKARVQFSARAGHFHVDGDPAYLSIVITNLIDNALKFTRGNPSIEIRTNNINDKLVIEVQDNGIGMDRDMRQKVFEKFFRVPQGNLHQVKGFGLGLSYVRAIVWAHDGSIEVDSVPGQGSTFRIILPVLQNSN